LGIPHALDKSKRYIINIIGTIITIIIIIVIYYYYYYYY